MRLFRNIVAFFLLTSTISLANIFLGAPVRAQENNPVRVALQMAHSGGISAIAHSADGRSLISGDGSGRIKVWDIASGRIIRTIEAFSGAAVSSIAASRTGNRFLVASDRAAWFTEWNLDTGARVRIFEKHSKGINRLLYSPDGTTILSAGNDGLAVQWDESTGRIIRVINQGPASWFESSDSIKTAAYSADGTRIATGGAQGIIKIWDAGTGRHLQQLGGPYWFPQLRGPNPNPGHDGLIRILAFTLDGSTLISGSYGQLKFWNTITARLEKTLEIEKGDVQSALVLDSSTALLGVTPSGWSEDGQETSLQILSLMTRAVTARRVVSSNYSPLSISSDRKTIARGTTGGLEIRSIADLTVPKPIGTSIGSVETYTFAGFNSNDGTLLSATGKAIHRWNFSSNHPVAPLAATGALPNERIQLLLANGRRVLVQQQRDRDAPSETISARILDIESATAV